MTVLEDRIRELAADATLNRPTSEVVARGRVIRRNRRRSGISIAAVAVALVATGTLNFGDFTASESPDWANGAPPGTPAGWPEDAINIDAETLRVADDACQAVSGAYRPPSSPPIAATSLGDGANVLLYRDDSTFWSCITRGNSTTVGAASLSDAQLTPENPLADACSTEVTSAQVAGTPVGDRTQHSGYHLVWGRASSDAASVVVTVDEQRAATGRSHGIFFALVPTTVDLNAPTTPIPAVSATAYSDSSQLGRASASC